MESWAPTSPLRSSVYPMTNSARPHPSDRRVLIALCLGTFLASFMFSAPTPFFPQIARELQVSVPLL